MLRLIRSLEYCSSVKKPYKSREFSQDLIQTLERKHDNCVPNNRRNTMKTLHLAMITATALFTLTACESMSTTKNMDGKDMDAKQEMSDNIEQQEIGSLMGHPLRTYTSGSMLTMDHNPERVNIEVDSEGKIVKIWKG